MATTREFGFRVRFEVYLQPPIILQLYGLYPARLRVRVYGDTAEAALEG